jgi:hypothetical protein
MTVREGPPQPAPPPVEDHRDIPAEKARGGEIILRKPWQRTLFIAGLAGAVILLLLSVFA